MWSKLALIGRSVTRNEEGATAVEYALLVSLIAVAIIVAVKALGVSVSGIFNNVVSSLS